MTIFRPSPNKNIALWSDNMKDWVNWNIPEPEAKKLMDELIKDSQNMVEQMREPNTSMFMQGVHYNIIMIAFRKNIYGKTDQLAITFFTDACVNYILHYSR